MIRPKYACLIIFICFVSCTSNYSDELPNRVFKYNQADNISSLDPAFAKSQNNMWAVNQIFDGLIGLNDSMLLVPRIAKSWSVNDLGTTFTFIIDQSYYFHEDECFKNELSRPVSAADVVYSFERILSDKLNSPGSWIFTDVVAKEQPFVALNDTTFVLKLRKPFQPILGILTMQYCSIVAPEAIEKYGKEFRNHPIGTGPFKMKRWQENQALYLTRNDYYPNIQHNLEGVKISFIPDKKIAFFEFLNGNLDFFSGIESSFGGQILDEHGMLRTDQSKNIRMYSNPFLNLEYIGVNMNLAKDGLLGDVKFRRALNWAIDRQELLAVLKNNVGKPAINGIIPKGLFGHNPLLKGYSYNPIKAKELLDEFDEDALRTTIKISTNADYLDVITYIAKSWENIGLSVKIELLESAVLRQQMREGRIELFRASWIADYPDEESYLCLFFGNNPAPPNYTRFRNAEYDELYSKAVIETDKLKRDFIHKRMDSIIIEHAPLIPIYYDETAVFASKKIKSGISANALNLLDFRNIKMN